MKGITMLRYGNKVCKVSALHPCLLQIAFPPLVVYPRLQNARGVGGMPTATGWDFRRRRDAKDGRRSLGNGWAEKAPASVQSRSFLYIIHGQCTCGGMPRVAQRRLGWPAVGCREPPVLVRRDAAGTQLEGGMPSLLTGRDESDHTTDVVRLLVAAFFLVPPQEVPHDGPGHQVRSCD